MAKTISSFPIHYIVAKFVSGLQGIQSYPGYICTCTVPASRSWQVSLPNFTSTGNKR